MSKDEAHPAMRPFAPSFQVPRVLRLGLLGLALLSACDKAKPRQVGGFQLSTSTDRFTLSGPDGRKLLEDASVRTGRFTFKPCYPDPLGLSCGNGQDILGWVRIARDWSDWTGESSGADPHGESYRRPRSEAEWGGAKVDFIEEGKGVIRLHVAGADMGHNGGSLSFDCGSNDAFLGLGERFDGVNQRGRIVPTVVEEGGVVYSGNDQPKPHLATYYPVPFYLSPRGYGLWVDVNEPTYFDFCSSDPKRASIEVLKLPFDVWLFADEDPLQIISLFTERTGRPKLSPPWVYAPWNDSVACSFVSGELNYGETCDIAKEPGLGERKVRALAALLGQEKIPSSVIFSEDWIGAEPASPFGYTIVADGTLDRGLYPNIEKLAQDLHAQGIRFLLYYFPYLIEDLDEDGLPRKGSDYAEGLEKGYVLKDASGRPYNFLMITRRVAQVDLTNPEAREWHKGILRRAISLGADGWMADFGEYTPLDAVAFDGMSGLALRNAFPLQWQKLNREVWDEARPNGDYVFFTRSGYTGTQKYSPVSWPGDQNTDWSLLDGIPSILPSALALGISGQPIFGHDIAGYTTIPGAKNTDQDLFVRWTELGAFSPIMKTHHGNEAGQNWSFDRDPTTLERYRFFANVHTALFPYLYGLAREASESGHPIMRHLYLHYPGETESVSIEDEFLLGPDLLVAPVLTPGTSSRTVYFPKGRWIDFWGLYLGNPDPTVYAGPARHEVPATRIPVFARAGASIPLLDPVPLTLDGIDLNNLSLRNIEVR